MLFIEIKYFNVLIDNKSVFDQPVKGKQEPFEKLIEMSRNDGPTRGNLLDFSYHENYYELIGIDLSRQTNKNVHQQINFTGKLQEDNGGTMFFIAEKQRKTISVFFRVINCNKMI